MYAGPKSITVKDSQDAWQQRLCGRQVLSGEAAPSAPERQGRQTAEAPRPRIDGSA